MICKNCFCVQSYSNRICENCDKPLNQVIEMKDNDCPFCSKSFQSGNDWVKHLQKIHNASPTDAYGYLNDKGYFFRDCIK